MNPNRLLLLAALGWAATLGLDRASAVTDPDRNKSKKVTDVRGEPDPGTLQGYRTQGGKSFYFQVTGTTTGSIWGTDVYTDDSSLATAAVHVGILRNGQKGWVKVTILPGKASYTASTRNGVTSNPYANWTASYRVEAVGPRVRVRIALVGKALDDPGTLSGYRDKVGKSFLFRIAGTTTGTVWGSGVYTDDSLLATAAVHAGAIRNGQKGLVKVTILAGQQAYQASTQNGVTTNNWGSWSGSFRVEAVK